jgi:thiol peroxidase
LFLKEILMSDRTTNMRGNALPLAGSELKAGDTAPDFKLHQRGPDGLKDVTLDDFAGKTLLLSVVPSLDTPVCEEQTKKLDESFYSLPTGVEILTVSMDLPFAQARFCTDKGVHSVQTASDHRDASFGTAYGTLIQPLRIMSRALFVVGPDKTIRYAEYVPEVTSHPNYESALDAVRQPND